MTDFPDWQAPQAHATAISTTGAPLLRLTTKIGSGSATSIPATGQVTLITAAPITQPGYEAALQLNLPVATGTIPFAALNVQWIDTSSGLAVSSKQYFLSAGNGPANALQYYIAGPCYGDQLTVTVTNLEAAAAMTLTWAFNQTSHIYEHDRIVQPLYGGLAPNGFTNPAGNPNAAVIAITRPTIAANSQASRLCAVRSGKALLCSDNGGGTANIWVALEDPNTLYSSIAAARMPVRVVNSGTDDALEVALPYGPVNITIYNKSTTVSVTPTVTLIGLDL